MTCSPIQRSELSTIALASTPIISPMQLHAARGLRPGAQLQALISVALTGARERPRPAAVQVFAIFLLICLAAAQRKRKNHPDHSLSAARILKCRCRFLSKKRFRGLQPTSPSTALNSVHAAMALATSADRCWSAQHVKA